MILSASACRVFVSPIGAPRDTKRGLFSFKLPEDQIPEGGTAGTVAGRPSREPARQRLERADEEGFKSHLDYVKERRSSQDAEDVLAGALSGYAPAGVLPDELLGDT